MDIKPNDDFQFSRNQGGVLLIACGALGRELIDLIEINHWTGFDIQCLPAIWHNRPEKIPDGVRQKIRAAKGKYRSIFVLYGDCGTGGKLDEVLQEEGVERIQGPHCYAFYSGLDHFIETSDNNVTSFYLTDYLARHFDNLIWKGLGMDRHPELLPLYFGNYRKVVYLAQIKDENLCRMAEAAAERLGLEYEYRFTGYGDMASVMREHL